MNKEIRGLQPVFDEWEIRVKSGDSECIAAFQVQTEALLLPVHHQQPIHERSVSTDVYAGDMVCKLIADLPLAI